MVKNKTCLLLIYTLIIIACSGQTCAQRQVSSQAMETFPVKKSFHGEKIRVNEIFSPDGIEIKKEISL